MLRVRKDPKTQEVEREALARLNKALQESGKKQPKGPNKKAKARVADFLAMGNETDDDATVDGFSDME